MTFFIRTATFLAICGFVFLFFSALSFYSEYKKYITLITALPEYAIPFEYSSSTMSQFKSLIYRDHQDKNYYLYLNDSTMGSNELSICSLLNIDTNCKVFGLSGAGFSPTIYTDIYKSLIKIGKPPRVLIFQVNLRYFSNRGFFNDTYYKNFLIYNDLVSRSVLNDYFEYLFSHNSSPLSYYAHRPYRTGQLYEDFFNQYDLENGIFKNYPSDDTTISSELAKDYSLAYTRTITSSHPMLLSLAELIRHAKANGTIIIAYGVPLNMEEGEELLGPDFRKRVSSNILHIEHFMAEHGVTFLDLSAMLGRNHFQDHGYANEHLDAEGRRLVANRLSSAINGLECPRDCADP